MTSHAPRLLRISLNVADLSRAQAYYRDALGFAPVAQEEADLNWVRLIKGGNARVRMARLRLGGQELELVEFDPPGAQYPPDSTAADLWFQHIAIVTNDIAAACRRAGRDGTTAITRCGPQRLPPAAGAVIAYKFRDPDGHPLELIHFPRGVGDPAWQCGGPDTTLGIDHSALSVADAVRSLAFYAALGLAPLSRQINTGPEQDCLDGLSKVAVDVVGLAPAAARTPHVELLCYHAPRGRPRESRGGACDIADSRLVFQVEDLTGLFHALAPVATEVAQILQLPSGSHAALVRDPDGHAILLLEDP